MRGIYHEGFTMREVPLKFFTMDLITSELIIFSIHIFLLMHIDQKIINEYVHPKKKT